MLLIVVELLKTVGLRSDAALPPRSQKGSSSEEMACVQGWIRTPMGLQIRENAPRLRLAGLVLPAPQSYVPEQKYPPGLATTTDRDSRQQLLQVKLLPCVARARIQADAAPSDGFSGK